MKNRYYDFWDGKVRKNYQNHYDEKDGFIIKNKLFKITATEILTQTKTKFLASLRITYYPRLCIGIKKGS